MTVPALRSRLRKHRTLGLCNLYTVERTDGVTLYFTDHDTELTVGGNVFEPAGGASMSALQESAGLKDMNTEIVGLITSDKITDQDLQNGKYRDAKITIDAVDIMVPWAGFYYRAVVWIDDLEFDSVIYKADVTGITRWMRKQIGEMYATPCRFMLGDERCKFAMGGGVIFPGDPAKERTLPADGDLFTVPTDPAVPNTRIRFEVGGLQTFIEPPFGDETVYDRGWLIFDQPGNVNEGVIRDVKSVTVRQAGARQIIELQTPLPNDVAGQGHIWVGCDKLPTTCNSKFKDPDGLVPDSEGNIRNYGGFQFIPTTDSLLRFSTQT